MIGRSLKANVRRYPWYSALYSAFFWMPIFFLFFAEFVDIGGVLTLEAIYYAAVVSLEVPSGYASDALGRRGTLLASAMCLLIGYLIFAAGASYAAFATAQIFLAGGIALHSGSATSLHYATLERLDRSAEYEEREAIAERWSRVATAAAAAVGGIAGLWDLRTAYILSALAAVGALGVAFSLVEPSSPSTDSSAPPGVPRFDRQLAACLRDLRRPQLAWAFGFALAATILNHVPYEFYQPYLDLIGTELGIARQTPAVTGLHMAAGTGIGAWVAGKSASVSRRIGHVWTLLAAMTLQLLIIGSMAAVLHIGIGVLIVLRGVPNALSAAPLRAVVAPRVPDSRRATFLSMQSLVGRLGFALTLSGLGWYAGSADPQSWPTLAALLRPAAVLGAAALALLVVLRPDTVETAQGSE